MKHFRWQIVLGLVLFALSASLYLAHYGIFRDPHHIFIYMVGDIAFVPIEVLFVTVIIHQLLNAREKRAMLEKLNMVIGTFFSEAGTGLLGRLAAFDPDFHRSKEKLIVTSDWSNQQFSIAKKGFEEYDYKAGDKRVSLDDLRRFLMEKRDFLLRLLENPNLLEHDTFTDLLWAVLHLTEELSYRGDLGQLPDSDHAHLLGDVKRAYILLIGEWLDYMRHLKNSYPYLFSLAIRTNPLDQNASPVVQ